MVQRIGNLTGVPDHDDNTGGGIVGANNVDVLVMRGGGGQLPLAYIEQTHRTHRLGLDGVQLLGVVSVDGMLQEQAVGVHGAVVLQHSIQHEHHPDSAVCRRFLPRVSISITRSLSWARQVAGNCKERRRGDTE